MDTAVEIQERMRQAELRLAPVRQRLHEFAAEMLDAAMSAKQPCIKYCRQKRRWRLVIPRGERPLPTPKIVFDEKA